MSAFAPSLPLRRPPQHRALRGMKTNVHRRHPRLSQAQPPPGTPRLDNALKNRSVIALRGLSDLGSVTFLHELAARIALPTTLSTFLQADTQLLLGGLIGVWTAAGLAERLREKTLSRIRESQHLPDRWDAAFVYNPEIMDDEVIDAVAWLYAFDELEGVQARELLNSVARNGGVGMRLRLAHALATVPVASNVVDSVLTGLLDDSDSAVRNTAKDALTTYHANAESFGIVTYSEDAQISAVLERIFAEPNDVIEETIRKSGILDRIAERVEAMGCAALSQPDLRRLTGDEVIDVEASVEKVEVPLFEGLRWSEIHGLCALALIPAAYELFSVADGGDLPWRFVGLGWLLTVGGLGAYPQSGMLWRRFASTIDKAHYEDRLRKPHPPASRAYATSATMALAATLLSTVSAIRQTAVEHASQPSESILYLGLGALLGVVYSLGTEKFLRAMQHRHIFVRNAMLWLAAVTWLVAVAVLIWVASRIYDQVDGGLEGFDRVLGVTIPFVVRADLVVDWAKRVSWALLNMSTWTQSAVQVRRLISRAPGMQLVVSIDHDVRSMIRNTQNRQQDLLTAEDRVWTEDAHTHSLVRISEVVQHFEKLGRVAIYACGCLVLAVPAAIVWIGYAIINGFISLTRSQIMLGSLYWISIFLAPLGAVIMILASAGLLCGVVTLSVVGTVIQFAVYWSTRTVYSMVRIVVSQAWAGFPDLKKPYAMPNVEQDPPGPNAGTMAVRALRHPEEAGAAISFMGTLLPSELEFALGSWDGTHVGHTSKPIGFSLSRHILSFGSCGDCFNHHSNAPQRSPRHDSRGISSQKRSRMAGRQTVSSQNAKRSRDQSWDDRNYDGDDDMEGADASADDVTPPQPVSHEEESKRVIRDNERVLILLGRLGLDLRIKSPRRRRLSTYYALGMLVHLQTESGGNAWRLHDTTEISEDEFDERIRNLNCVVADEAKDALEELSHRLRGSSKYRVIPTGYPTNRMIPVQVWLRLLLLSFLETPSESDGGKIAHRVSEP